MTQLNITRADDETFDPTAVDTIVPTAVVAEPATAPARAPRPLPLHLLHRLAWAIMAVGALLRIARYLANRSLWLDEVLLARNILERSFGQLLQPLDLNQAAPVGFLMLQKLSVTLLGGSEYALRLVPLLAGLAALPLFWFLARRLLELPVAVFAIALFAVCEPLIYYTSEAKQYGLDVAIALAILLSAARVMEAPQNARRLAAFAAVGILSVWFSHPAIFVLAGTGTVLIVYEWRARRAAAPLILISCLWAVSFAAHYLLFMRPLGSNEYLRQYWSTALMPWSLPAAIKWSARTFWEVFRDRARAPVNLLLPEIAIFTFILGATAMLLRRRKVLLFLAMPVVFALAAAAAHVYPFSDRLILFTTPLFLLVIAAGTGFVYNNLSERRVLIGGLLAAALIAPSTLLAAKNLLRPPGNEEARSVLQYVEKNRQPGDTLYLYHSAKYVFPYYAPRTGLHQVQPVVGTMNRGNWFGYIQELQRLRGRPRVWIFFIHNHKLDGVDEQKLFLMTLNRIGRQLKQFESTGAAAYLYDLSNGETASEDPLLDLSRRSGINPPHKEIFATGN